MLTEQCVQANRKTMQQSSRKVSTQLAFRLHFSVIADCSWISLAVKCTRFSRTCRICIKVVVSAWWGISVPKLEGFNPWKHRINLVNAFNVLITVMILLELLDSIPEQILQPIPLFYGEKQNKTKRINKKKISRASHMV